MSEHPTNLTLPLRTKGTYKKRFCPACHRVIKNVVRGHKTTFIVHGQRDVCVVDNAEVGANAVDKS